MSGEAGIGPEKIIPPLDEGVTMSKTTDISKRDFIKTAAGVGAVTAAGLIAGSVSPKEASAQLLESGISENSSLARVKREGKLRIGYSQTTPWFMLNARTRKLEGIYYDVCERLGRDLEIKIEYQEVSWANATVGLRKGDYDIFGSSLFYTMPRALVISYVGPMWRKGRLALTHKDYAHMFKSEKDFNDPSVTWSHVGGASEENWITTSYPDAKRLAIQGHEVMALEMVRNKKAHLYGSGETSIRIYAEKNKDWARVVDNEHSIGLAPNTWAIRYGDPEWQTFLNFYASHLVASGYMQRRYDAAVRAAAAS